ncbi:MAG: IS3 family transposase [Solirubrobacterales bacterium]
MRRQTHYSSEFRAEAVRLAETSGQSIRQVALELGISNESLGRWVTLAHQRPAGAPLADEERAELVELRRRVKVLETEREILRKAAGLLRSGDRADPVTRFRFVEQEKARYPVRILCVALGVSPSGYYAWRSRGPSARERADAVLAAEIRRSHARSRGTYGVPRIHADLAEAGQRVSRKRVARLMRADHLAGVHRRRFVRTTIRDEHAAPFPDLVNRDFSATGPDRLWVADITALPTRAGVCYLASIVDAWSRRVVGWSMASHMRAELVTAALEMALVHRRPGSDVVHHSDHGSQYTSLAFGCRLRESGIAASMGSVGDCYDNAMAESFFATLETELIDRSEWASPAAAKAAVFDYIEVFYNRIRRHSSLGNLSPGQYEERYRSTPAVAVV